MAIEIYEKILNLQSAGGVAALATIVSSNGSVPRRIGAKMLVNPDRSVLGSVGGGIMESAVIDEAVEAMKTGEGRKRTYEFDDEATGICGGTVEVFIEPIMPERRLVIVGAGHIGKALARCAQYAGFRVAVVDDRQEFASANNFPNAEIFTGKSVSELIDGLHLDANDYVVVATRGYKVDVDAIAPLLKREPAYIGLMGSKKKIIEIEKAAMRRGVTKEQLQRVYAPVGFELNAETPEEIAISIVAEIVHFIRNDGKSSPASMSSKTRTQ